MTDTEIALLIIGFVLGFLVGGSPAGLKFRARFIRRK